MGQDGVKGGIMGDMSRWRRMAALVPALLGLAACAQAITQPYHIVTTPRLERPIVFERQ